MFTEGIFPIENGLLDIDESRLKSLLVQDDINEIYDVEQTPFARGKFAAVRRAVHKGSGVHFAAKFLKRRRRAQSSDKEIKHEIAVLTLCDGAENIVKLNAVHESRSDTALLLELATGGELQTFLDNEECLSEADARFSMREVLKGLQFLHKRSIAHLDLKPQNILLTGERIEDGLKLCDFGISRVVVEGTNVREIVGTPDYVAPEVLQYEPLSLLTDIWSVGVLAYVLLSGFSPFGGETKQETFLNISQCALTFPEKLFNGVSAAAIDFIRRALRIKPSDRMTAAGCLEHFWLKDDCSIDRHIFGNGKALKSSAALDDENDHHDDDDDDDNDVDEDEEEDEDDVEDEEEEEEEEDAEDDHDIISIESDEAEDNNGVEQEFEISSDENNSLDGGIINGNGGSKMDSSDIESEQQQHCNGLREKRNGGSLVNGKTRSSTTTAVYTVPAARATTIPLCHTKHQQQQQQQLQQQQQQMSLTVVRRHSTDSNKENTYLATKKIMPTNNLTTVVKKSTIQPATINKSTATIIIGTEHHQHQQQQLETTGSSCSSSSSSNSNGVITAAPCLFPDAPTTPKVIRKAPNTETSPTSVKALVKKFQLEGAEKHLKEAQSNQQQQSSQQHQLPHGVGPRKSLQTTLTSGSKFPSADHHHHHHNSAIKKCTNGIQQSQNKSNNSKAKHNSNITTNGHSYMSNRRLSEPITAVHQQHKKQMSSTLSSMSPPKSPLSTASDTVMNYKTTCVYCLTCGSSSMSSSSNCCTVGCGNNETNVANGCRHSTTATPSQSRSTSTSSSSSSSSSSLTATATTTLNVASRNSTTATATAAAILLSNHHQHHHHSHPHSHHHHHHHHHHVVVAKNVAANNLSLDQGIIC